MWTTSRACVVAFNSPWSLPVGRRRRRRQCLRSLINPQPRRRSVDFKFWKVLLEFSFVYLNKPFGFLLPPREVVHPNI